MKQVLICIHSLGRAAKRIKDYNGPTLGGEGKQAGKSNKSSKVRSLSKNLKIGLAPPPPQPGSLEWIAAEKAAREAEAAKPSAGKITESGGTSKVKVPVGLGAMLSKGGGTPRSLTDKDAQSNAASAQTDASATLDSHPTAGRAKTTKKKPPTRRGRPSRGKSVQGKSVSESAKASQMASANQISGTNRAAVEAEARLRHETGATVAAEARAALQTKAKATANPDRQAKESTRNEIVAEVDTQVASDKEDTSSTNFKETDPVRSTKLFPRSEKATMEAVAAKKLQYELADGSPSPEPVTVDAFAEMIASGSAPQVTA
eukprot:SAG31_NODE_10304_length_1157_cov_1.465028_1_plen_316_part_10